MGSGDYEIVTRDRDINRRRFLQWGALGALSALMPAQGLAAVRGPLRPERSLSLYNIHTGEKLRVVYWFRGEYLPAALAEINHILRDHRTGEVKAIDTRLLDLAYTLRGKFEGREPFHVISGYRSPETNALLRANGHGVAENSLHVQGKAVDIQLPGRDLALLRRAAIRLGGGGVGYYPGPGFIHIDVGRVRHW